MTDNDKALVERRKGHTPGPWIFKRRKYGTGFTREIWSSSGLFIASLTTRMTGGDATEANANLIASAPAMIDRIEALSAENERLRYELRCIFRGYQSCMADEWIADVRAALGETK